MADLRFGFWIPQEAVVPRWSPGPGGAGERFAYVKWLTQLAEARGFDYAFAPARSAVGAFAWLDALAVTSALAATTRRVRLIPTLRPYLRQPRLTAKTIHSIDAISGGRAGVNILAAAAGGDFAGYREMLDHDAQYRQIAEFARVLRAVWHEEAAADAAVADATAGARPADAGDLPVFLDGSAHASRDLAGAIADWCVLDEHRPEIVAAQIQQVREAAERAGRDPRSVRFALSGLLVMRETDRVAHADLRAALQGQHGSERPRRGWFGVGRPDPAKGANGGGGDLADGAEGWLKSSLVGAEGRVVDRIGALEAAGIDLLVAGFLDNPNDLPAFAGRVIAKRRGETWPMPRSVDPAIRQALGLGG